MEEERDEDFHIEQDNNLDDSVVAEEAQGETIKKLRGKLKDAEAKAKEYLDSWQRAQADFLNIRKRDEEDKLEFMKFANKGLLQELIPVLDSFNIALSQGHTELEAIYTQLASTLKSNGLEEINPSGEAFDPRFHEALSVVEVDKEEEDGKVLEVLQRGYTLSEKVIRPAKVKVGEFKSN